MRLGGYNVSSSMKDSRPLHVTPVQGRTAVKRLIRSLGSHTNRRERVRLGMEITKHCMKDPRPSTYYTRMRENCSKERKNENWSAIPTGGRG